MKFIINLFSLIFFNRTTRRIAKTKLTRFFYARRLGHAWEKYPELHDKIVVATNGGLADQITFLLAIREFQSAGCHIVFNLAGLYADLPESARLYNFSEIAHIFGKKKREIINDFAITPFELYRYKINWDGVLFANLPTDFVDAVKIIGITVPKIDNKIARLAPLYLDGVGAIPSKDNLFPKYKKFLEKLEINYKLNAENAAKLIQIKSTENSICIHIRRGDMIGFLGGRTVSADYFHNAINEIIKRTGWKKAICFVFSDDAKWAKKAIDYSTPGAKITADFVQINDITDPQSELELMRNCKHFIISVGFFARLARAMCKNPKSIIIHPNADDFVINAI